MHMNPKFSKAHTPATESRRFVSAVRKKSALILHLYVHVHVLHKRGNYALTHWQIVIAESEGGRRAGIRVNKLTVGTDSDSNRTSFCVFFFHIRIHNHLARIEIVTIYEKSRRLLSLPDDDVACLVHSRRSRSLSLENFTFALVWR